VLRLASGALALLLLAAPRALRAQSAEPPTRVEQLAALSGDDPNSALAQADPQLLVRLIHAYTNPLDYAAMPAIVRLVAASRATVREAARAAVARYGKNAIWQLREVYAEHAGQAAERSWDGERTARELYRVLDRAQREDAESLLARGLAHLAAHELAAMRVDYDLLLTKHPQFSERNRLAAGYAALGAERLAHDDLAGAVAAYRRALWLDANAGEAQRWRAQLEYAAAELALTHGVADLAGYERALRLDPQLSAARRAQVALSGERARRLRERKHAAAAASLVLFSVLAGVLLVNARKARPAPSAG
jgi:hypothetical protein